MFAGSGKVKDVLYGGPGPDHIFVRYNGDTGYVPSAWLVRDTSGCEKWIMTSK